MFGMPGRRAFHGEGQGILRLRGYQIDESTGRGRELPAFFPGQADLYVDGRIERDADDFHQPFQSHPHQKRNANSMGNERLHRFDLTGIEYNVRYHAFRLAAVQYYMALEKVVFQ